MKLGPAATVVLLVAVTIVVRFPVLAIAQSPPSLVTDKPLYTLRDKQVLLQGEGYRSAKMYYVWLQTPADNSTRGTGVSFVTTEKGDIPSIPPATAPPAVLLPIDPNSLPGTYLVSISDSPEGDTAISRAHYGIWGPEKYVYQRTETLQVGGGGILPKANLDVTIRNFAGTLAYGASIVSDRTGGFVTTWRIPPDVLIGAYTVFIDGIGTYDDPTAEFVSSLKLSVTPAVLNVTVLTEPDGPYERMQVVSSEFVVQYPDSTPVVSMKEGLKPVAFYAGQFRRANLGLTASDTTSGIWIAERRIQRNATTDANYRFVMIARAFDDGYGNIGPERDVETRDFSVVPATLQVKVALNSTHYQIPFDTITAYIQVNYRDGTPVTNDTVRAWLSAADSRVNVTLTYDRAAAAWIVNYAFSLGDLLRPGTWTLLVEAKDIYGNAGSVSLELVAEPYSFLAIVSVIVITVLVARWLLSKCWRRLYLGAKRISSALGGRLKPPFLGQCTSDSPGPL